MAEDQTPLLNLMQGLHTKIDKKAEETHKRIDGLVKKTGQLEVRVAEVRKDVKQIQHDSPCTMVLGLADDTEAIEGKLDGHLGNHRTTRKERVKVLLGLAVTIVGTGCAIVFGAWLVVKLGLS